MAKKIRAMLKVQAPAGAATAAPPVGPALGQHGINIMEFIKAFNERTADLRGYVVPAEITVFEDRSFTFVTKAPLAAALLKRAAGVDSGCAEPNKEKVGKVSRAQLREIAEMKMADLNANTVEQAMKIIEGTARSMGIEVACHDEARTKYTEAAKLVEPDRRYEIAEAAELLPKLSISKFDGTVEAHLRLGVDPRHADQLVRGTVVLPHGTGKTSRVIVFAQGEKAQEALRAGADDVGGDDLVKRIDDGWFEFDVAIATPDMMGTVGRLGKKLGPRGLMPNPKSGTVTFDIERAVGEIKSGRIEFKVDRAGIVHVPVGRASFTPEQLAANVATLVDAINRAKPSGAKGTYMRTLTLAPTMGPGVRIDIPSALAAANASGLAA